MATTLGAKAWAKAKAGRPPSSHHTRGRRGGAVRCLAYQKYEDVRGRRRGGRESGTSGGDGTETGRWLSVAGPSVSSSTSSSKVSDDGDGFGERLEDRYDVGRTVGKGGYGVVREERRQAAFARVDKMKSEEQRLLAVVSKWENVDRSKAAVAL